MHCNEQEVFFQTLLCPTCFSFLERASIKESSCHKAFVFYKEGPILSLLRHIEGPLRKEILKTIASFMVLHLYDLSWQSLDQVIPIESTPTDKALALELSTILGLPYTNRKPQASKLLAVGIYLKQDARILTSVKKDQSLWLLTLY